MLLIAASILAARKLAQYEPGKRVPGTICANADSIRWAEEIMLEIDRRYPPEIPAEFRHSSERAGQPMSDCMRIDAWYPTKLLSLENVP